MILGWYEGGGEPVAAAYRARCLSEGCPAAEGACLCFGCASSKSESSESDSTFIRPRPMSSMPDSLFSGPLPVKYESKLM